MKRFSFPRRERLHRPQEFKRICQNGRLRTNRYLSLYALSSPKQFPRVGFSVGKRIGKASSRNRVKRLLREIYRFNRPRLRERVDIVVVVKQGVTELGRQSLEASLLGLFKGANLFVE